jgi:hypothetical protein
VWDEFDQETSESELAAVPSCHGSVPNRYAATAPCSAITIAIRNNSLAHFSRAAPGHFSRALKTGLGGGDLLALGGHVAVFEVALATGPAGRRAVGDRTRTSSSAIRGDTRAAASCWRGGRVSGVDLVEVALATRNGAGRGGERLATGRGRRIWRPRRRRAAASCWRARLRRRPGRGRARNGGRPGGERWGDGRGRRTRRRRPGRPATSCWRWAGARPAAGDLARTSSLAIAGRRAARRRMVAKLAGDGRLCRSESARRAAVARGRAIEVGRPTRGATLASSRPSSGNSRSVAATRPPRPAGGNPP